MGRFIRFLATGSPAGALLVLAAAPVACGGSHDDGGSPTSAEIFPACPEPTFEALSLPEPLSGIEWREACTQEGKPVFLTRQLLGLSCSESGCASAIQALDAARAQAVVALPGGATRLTCRSYVVAMREDQVVATADSVSELPGLLGPLDTPAEAAFAVAFYGVACQGLRSASNGFEVLSVEEQDSCPIQVRDVTYALSSAAAFARIQTGAWESTRNCH